MGYILLGIRNSRDAHIGDTFYHTGSKIIPLPGFKAAKPMVHYYIHVYTCTHDEHTHAYVYVLLTTCYIAHRMDYDVLCVYIHFILTSLTRSYYITHTYRSINIYTVLSSSIIAGVCWCISNGPIRISITAYSS